jgi:hypothetical protein
MLERRELRRTPPKRHQAVRPKPPEPRPVGKPSVQPTYYVAVLGDSLGQMLGSGLTEAFADVPEIAVLRKARESSGLVRDDFYDWTKAARDLVASNEKINIAVMLIGSNDRQTVRTASGTYDARSPKWEEIYAARVAAIAEIFHEKKIPLVWVGLPVMKSERFSADMIAFNEIYREHASNAGATFVDIWEAFGDDKGRYSATGPDVNGQTVKLRTADGVHFTTAGARKLAHFVEGEIRRNFEEVKAQSAPAIAALPSDAGPVPAEPSAAPPKPLAGPVMPLNAPYVSSGGQLATRAKQPPGPLAGPRALIDHVLVKGDPLEPKSGRADDFSWPQESPSPRP